MQVADFNNSVNENEKRIDTKKYGGNNTNIYVRNCEIIAYYLCTLRI